MNEQTEGLGSSTPADVPMKRKRGRPRKVVSGVQGTNIPVMPDSSNKLNSSQTVGTTDVCDDGMLGKEVACVIEGTFNGGYLVNVQVAADTYLRGVVFLPEPVVPVTAESDVTAQVRMIERTEIPIPVPVRNPETQIHSSVPLSGQCNKQPFEAELQVPMSVDPVLPTELHSGISVSLENQSAPVVALAPMSDLPKIDSSISTGGIVPKGMSKPGPECQAASVMSDLEGDKTVTQDEPLHDVDASRQAKESSVDGGATEDSQKTSEPINLVPTVENITTGQQSMPSVYKLNELIRGEPNQSIIKINQIPASAEHESMPSEHIVAPLADLPKLDSSISTGGIMPKGMSKPGPESQPASIMSEFEGDRTVIQIKTLHDVDASRQAKEYNADVGATKDSQKTSEPTNLIPTVENTEKELATGQQSMPSVYKLTELIPDQPKRSIIEINQIPVSTEHESMPSEHISNTVDNFVQKQGSPETGTQEGAKTKLVIETITKADTANSKGGPSTDIANIPDVGSNHALEFSHPSILYDRKPVPSESKLLSEGSDFQEMSDPQNCSSFGAINVDANQPTQVLATSLESENPIGTDAS
ncbi:hypothetical protein E2542_SST00885 [Spatholobus suberectus]|nr:hypothetical protein E2542_SST00885 [Spatholobus suberectus]